MLLRIKRIVLVSIVAVLLPLASQASGLKIDYNSQAFTNHNVSLKINTIQADNVPWNLEMITPAFSYSFQNFGFYDPSRLLTLKINYDTDSKGYKQVYIYDDLAKVWGPVKSVDNPEKKEISVQVNATQGKVVVLEKSDLMTRGTASWYEYKGGDFAASPDFPKGSKLKVYNLDNNKSVIVTINDWGPERDKFPNRVIDLDKVAFSKLASPSLGLINVRIEPVEIVKSKVDVDQVSGEPNVSADYALIMNADTGDILWSKDKDHRTSIASLTKLVAIKVFLDTRPSLNKVITYHYQDEKYNYKYVKPWESAKLLVKEGETMTVKDLVYSSLVGSANNAVETLVRVSGLSRDEFVARMNNFVWSLGLRNTHFIEPTGLSPENVSSASDYAIISKEVLKNPLIRKISSTYCYKFKIINTGHYHYLRNTDRLLRENKHNILASKTGYLDEAGYCLMTYSHTKFGNIIVINLNSKTKDDEFIDNERLMLYGQKLLNK